MICGNLHRLIFLKRHVVYGSSVRQLKSYAVKFIGNAEKQTYVILCSKRHEVPDPQTNSQLYMETACRFLHFKYRTCARYLLTTPYGKGQKNDIWILNK